MINISNWFLEGILENDKKLTININKNPFVIGRDKTCNLALTDNTISRRHAEIFLKGNSLAISDLNSTNGTFVNNIRIKTGEPLKNGDSVKFANIDFQIVVKDNLIKDVIVDTHFLHAPQQSIGFAKYYDLSNREEEILFLLLQGKSTKSIADKLFISSGTAKNHILNIYKKTNTHSKFELLTQYNNFIKSSQ